MGDAVVERPKYRRCPPALDPYPWLVYHGEDASYQTFCTISDPNKTYPRRIPELDCADCWSSCHGWCVLSKAQIFFLWNPTTLEKINLPSLRTKHLNHLHHGILTSPPNDPNCMVILFAKKRSFLRFYRLGDKQWTTLDYEEDLKRCLLELGEWNDERKDYVYLPVICNAKLFVTSSWSDKLLLIDELTHNKITFKHSQLNSFPLMHLYASRQHSYILEFEGQIFGINLIYEKMEEYDDIAAVEIFKLDIPLMGWEEVSSAEGLAFFVSLNNSFCCRAMKHESEGNKVYFTLSKSKNLYSYNIEDGTLSVLLPFSNLSTAKYLPFWLLLPYQRLTSPQEEAKLKTISVDATKRRMRNVKRRESTINEKDKLNKKDTKDTKEIHFLDLPFDIASLIAEYLVLVDYLHFRAACRKCRSVAPPISWKTNLNNHSLPVPWLMFFGNRFTCTLFDPLYGERYFMELSADVLCYAKDGWIVIHNRANYLMYLFQPFTREKLQLPNPNNDDWTTTCIGFSSTPTSSNCLIVSIDNDSACIGVFFTRLGEEEWHYTQFQNASNFWFYTNSPVFYKEAFYYLGQSGDVGVLRITNNIATWDVLPTPKKPCDSYLQNFLLECGGGLLSVFVGYSRKWVQIFQLEQSTMTWIQVKDLGKYTLYVSRSSSFSTVTNIPGMENKIYFPRFYGDDIVFYSLDTERYHSRGNKGSSIDFYSTREQLHCCWIQPKWG